MHKTGGERRNLKTERENGILISLHYDFQASEFPYGAELIVLHGFVHWFRSIKQEKSDPSTSCIVFELSHEWVRELARIRASLGTLLGR